MIKMTRPQMETDMTSITERLKRVEELVREKEDLLAFAKEHGLKVGTIADLVQYRKEHECFVECVEKATMPTKYGDFTIYGYINKLNGEHHIALVKGDVADGKPVLCRVHSECLTGDVFGSKRCDCGEQFDAAMKMIAKEGRGVLLYLRQEGRRINTCANRAVNCLFLIVELLSQLFPVIFACSVLSQTYHAPGNHVIVRYIHKKDGKKNSKTI